MSEKWEEHWKAIRSVNERLPAYSAAVLRDAVKDLPDAFAFWMLLGNELTSLGRLDEAEEALQRGLPLTPADKRHGIYSLMGHIAKAAGDFRGAEEWYKKDIEADPKHPSAYVYLGALHAGMGELEDAEITHRAGTECSGGCVDEALYNLGLVLRAQNRFDEAKDCFLHAIELDPEYDVAREALEDVEKAMAYLAEKP